MAITLMADYIMLKFCQHIKYDMVTLHVFEKVSSCSAVVGRKDWHIKKSCIWLSIGLSTPAKTMLWLAFFKFYCYVLH